MTATFQYFPFDAGPGSDATEAQWVELFSWMRTSGILTENLTLSNTGDCAVTQDTGLDLVVQIYTGVAFIEGTYFAHTGDNFFQPITFNDDPDGYDRIDLITIRVDFGANTTEYTYLEGTPAMSPVAPTPIQVQNFIWDLPLASIYVANGVTAITDMDITDERVRSVQGEGGSSAVTLASAGGSETIVADGVGPALQNKGLSASTGISLSSDASSVTITNSDPASSVTLTNAGSGSTLVNDSTGPSLAVKSLTASTNINFTVSGTDITISANSTPTDSPICLVYRNTTQSLPTSTATTITFNTVTLDPYSMWDSIGGQKITIPSNGVYFVSAQVLVLASALSNGWLSMIIFKNATDYVAYSYSIVAGGSNYVSVNASAYVSLSTSDYLTASCTNLTGTTFGAISSGGLAPLFQVVKVRS